MNYRVILFLFLSFVAMTSFAKRAPNQDADATDVPIGNIKYSVVRGSAERMDVLSLKDKHGVICAYQGDKTFIESFLSIRPLEFSKDPNRFFLTLWENPSLEGPEEIKILDTKPANDNRKIDVVLPCTFGTADSQNQVFAGLNVNYEFANDLLTIKELYAKEINASQKFIRTTKCKLTDGNLTCDKGVITPYLPNNP